MGRGLGLPAALGILRGHQGQVQVVSGSGQGTKVRVYLPVRRTTGAGAPAAASGTPKGILLFVEDDPEVRQPVAELVRSRLGYEVLEAASGEEAIALFQGQPDRISLILMDATMPGLGGPATFDAIRRIRPEVRAILCSGYGEEAGRAAMEEHGFTAFLRKPFSLGELEELLAWHFGKP
jgi:CheY-like chemotaxis protein